MPVAKLKNIALLILLAANLILLGFLVPNRAAQQRQELELRESLSGLFADEGIVLAADSIPQTRTLYALQLTGSTADQLRAAAALLGEQLVAQDAQVGFLRNFRSAYGSCGIGREGYFLAELSGLDADAGTVLEQMGFSCASVKEDGQQYTATQSVLDIPVFSDGLQLSYENGLLTRVEGVFYSGGDAPARIGRDACMSAADALVRFLDCRYSLGWVGSEVLSLEQGYVHVATASVANIQLKPVWKLVTDSGSFMVDGLTGEVSSVS